MRVVRRTDIRQRFTFEAQFAIRIVFNYHDVVLREGLAHLLAVLGCIGKARRILEVRDKVDHLRTRIECCVQLVDVEPFARELDPAEYRLLKRESLDGSKVGGVLHDHAIALVEQHLAEQVKDLLRARGDEHVIEHVIGAEALVVTIGDPLAELIDACGRGILEGVRALLSHHALHRFQKFVFGKRNGIGQSTCERGHVRVGCCFEDATNKGRRSRFDPVGKQCFGVEKGCGVVH